MFLFFHLVHKRLFRHPASRFSLLGVILAIILSMGTTSFSTAFSAEPMKLMVFGDSLTAGYGLPKPDSFTEKLSSALKSKGLSVQIIPASVSGDTTSGGKARLAWSLADKPDAVLLELGANDGLRGIDPALSRKNLETILSQLQSKGIKILLAGMLAPPNLGREYGAEFNQIFPALAKKFNVPLYPFFLEGVAAVPELNQKDGIHPNAQGVDEIIKRILPMVVKLVQ